MESNSITKVPTPLEQHRAEVDNRDAPWSVFIIDGPVVLISKREAARRLGDIHPESLMRMVRQGRAPKPVILCGGNRVAFVEAEIQACAKAMMAARCEAAE